MLRTFHTFTGLLLAWKLLFTNSTICGNPIEILLFNAEEFVIVGRLDAHEATRM